MCCTLDPGDGFQSNANRMRRTLYPHISSCATHRLSYASPRSRTLHLGIGLHSAWYHGGNPATLSTKRMETPTIMRTSHVTRATNPPSRVEDCTIGSRVSRFNERDSPCDYMRAATQVANPLHVGRPRQCLQRCLLNIFCFV
jgi:hypothetical protein